MASELARSRGKRAGVAVALSLAAVTSVPALAADSGCTGGKNRERRNTDKSRQPDCLRYGQRNDHQYRAGTGAGQ
nr:autotransporter adhesin family protein [Escherichia coli]